MQTLEQQFSRMKSNLKSLLSKQEYVCTTCDVWSSQARSFLGVTFHFIDSNYERQSFVLAFRELKQKQSYDYLAKVLNGIFKEFGLTVSKITHVITDGGSAFCKCFRVYARVDGEEYIEEAPASVENEDEEELDLRPTNSASSLPFMQENGEFYASNHIDFNAPADSEQNPVEEYDDIILQEEESEPIELPPQRRCFSHLLNLISSDFDKLLTGNPKTVLISAVSKLHALWVLCSRSSLASQKCKEVLGCKLLVPCITRWNSKYDSISKCMRPEIKPKLNMLIQKLKLELSSGKKLLTLTANDFNVLDDYLKIFRPVASALDGLQGDKLCSQGYILPTLVSLRIHISSQTGRSSLVTYRDAMLKALNNRFEAYLKINDDNRALILSAMSTPRFKLDNIVDIENKRCDADACKSYLIQECVRLSGTTGMEDASSELTPTDSENDGFFVSFKRQTVRRNSIDTLAEDEVEKYLKDDRKNVQILNEYPLIRNVYFRHNTTLASSGVVERLFSQSQMIFAPRRNRITSEHFEMSLLVEYNRVLVNQKEK